VPMRPGRYADAFSAVASTVANREIGLPPATYAMTACAPVAHASRSIRPRCWSKGPVGSVEQNSVANAALVAAGLFSIITGAPSHRGEIRAAESGVRVDTMSQADAAGQRFNRAPDDRDECFAMLADEREIQYMCLSSAAKVRVPGPCCFKLPRLPQEHGSTSLLASPIHMLKGAYR
jgi:hypothetical protein